MSLEEKTTAIPNMQSTPFGDKEKSDKRKVYAVFWQAP